VESTECACSIFQKWRKVWFQKDNCMAWLQIM